MASEVFNNFLSKKSLSSNNTLILVPVAGQSLPDGIGSRTADSVAQIHSIYITQEVSDDNTQNPLNKKVFITLSIVDTSANNGTYCIANNVLVLPHSAFYIEKTITLKNNQRLVLTYSNLNSTSRTLHCVCSGVDMIQ